MHTIKYLLVLFMLTGACSTKNRKNDPTPEESTPKGTLLLHLHNYIDVTEVDGYNIVYTTTTEGRKILLTKAQFYLSDFELVKLDGSFYKVKGAKILKVQEGNVYEVGEVPVGNYKSIRFKVGLNSSTNGKIPNTSTSNILNKPDMWFGASAQPDGFIFSHISGTIDTTAAANGLAADMKPFHYCIGTNAQYNQVVMPIENYTIVEGQVEYIHLYADLSKLFDGIQLNINSNLTMTSAIDNSTALGIKLGNNMKGIFNYE